MGTNFYWIGQDIKKHIGKRSAAGPYCWDCDISLYADGHDKIHTGDHKFLEQCPICGKKPEKEDFNNSTAGRELGFNKNNPKRKTGVKTCSSFTWAMSPGHFHNFKSAKNLHIEDEYKRKYTLLEFSKVLSECPVKYFHSIGAEFS